MLIDLLLSRVTISGRSLRRTVSGYRATICMQVMQCGISTALLFALRFVRDLNMEYNNHEPKFMRDGGGALGGRVMQLCTGKLITVQKTPSYMRYF